VRREWRWVIAAVAALTLGVTCAEAYAQLAAPYYAAVDRLIAAMQPWTIEELVVTRDPKSPGMVLRLTGEIRRQRDDSRPAAMVVSRVQVGEAIETPLVFLTLILVWPAATSRERLLRLAVGLPVWLSLEAITTAVQLLHPMAEAAAILSGDDNPLTPWERWSRFLESGGRFVLAFVAALLALTLTQRLSRRPPLVTAPS
jgi:hypothetical protein